MGFGTSDPGRLKLGVALDIASEATYLFGGPERLPSGGDILADLAEDGPGAASGGHVTLARSRASVQVLLSRQSEYDGIESFIWKYGLVVTHEARLI